MRSFWNTSHGRAAVLSALALVAGGRVSAQSTVGIRDFTLSSKVIQEVNLKVGFTTIISLPPDELVLDTLWGDESAFKVVDADNILKVTALKPGAETNLTLIMPDAEDGSRRVYTFLLREGVKGVKPDLQLVAKSPKPATETGRPRPVMLRTEHEAQLEKALEEERASAKVELDTLRDEVLKTIQQTDEKVVEALTARQRYDTQPLRTKPFFVQDVWADHESTWIELKVGGATGAELPVVYEILDGKPAMLDRVVIPGPSTTLIKIPKVVSQAYLEAGKAKWRFSKAARN